MYGALYHSASSKDSCDGCIAGRFFWRETKVRNNYLLAEGKERRSRAPVKRPFGGTEEELQALVKTLPLPAAPYIPGVVPVADDIPRYTRRRPSDYSDVPLHHSSVASLNLESSSSDSDQRQALSDPTKVSRGMQMLTRGERMRVPSLLESGSLPTASHMPQATQLGDWTPWSRTPRLTCQRSSLLCWMERTMQMNCVCSMSGLGLVWSKS
jgi:hypothetical protein